VDTKAKATGKILIVDDDPMLRKTLFDILNAKGYTSIAAATGEAALELIKEQIPAVALVDLKLEGMQGLDVMRGIKECCPDTECIVLTGHASRDSAIEAVNLGAYSYLQKPYDVELITIRMATEKQEVKKALRESEEIFRTCVEAAPSLLSICDEKGNNIYVSPNCEELTGYTQEELIGGLRWWVHEDDTPRAKEFFERTFREGVGGKDFEYTLLKKNGEVRHVLSSWEPLKDEEEKFKGIVFQTIDITERKRAEEHIKHLNSVLKAIRTVNQLVVMEKDRDTLLQKACDALIEARGYDGSWLGFVSDGEENFATVKGSGFGESITRFCEDVIGGDHPPCIRNALAQKEKFMSIGGSGECEDCSFKNAHMGKEAAIIHVEHAGRLFGLLAVVFAPDVTVDDEEKGLLIEVAGDIAFALHDMELEEAHRRANEALQESEDKFRTLSEQSLVGITLVQDYLFKYANQTLSAIFEYSIEEMLNWKPKEYAKIIHSDDLAFVMRQAQRKQLGDEDVVTNYEWRVVTKTGKVKWVETYSKTISYEGKTADFVTVIDITERKQAEEERKRTALLLQENVEQLEEAKRRVEEACSLREHFLKETSHRIITPVTIIGGCAQLLLESNNLDDAKKRILESCKRETRKSRNWCGMHWRGSI